MKEEFTIEEFWSTKVGVGSNPTAVTNVMQMSLVRGEKERDIVIIKINFY